MTHPELIKAFVIIQTCKKIKDLLMSGDNDLYQECINISVEISENVLNFFKTRKVDKAKKEEYLKRINYLSEEFIELGKIKTENE